MQIYKPFLALIIACFSFLFIPAQTNNTIHFEGCANKAFADSLVFTFNKDTVIVVGGISVSLKVDSVEIIGVKNLPFGLSYSCNPSNCKAKAGSSPQYSNKLHLNGTLPDTILIHDTIKIELLTYFDAGPLGVLTDSSVYNYPFSIYPSYSDTITFKNCDSVYVPQLDSTIYSSTTIASNMKSISGCDSIHYYEITVNKKTTSLLQINACDQYIPPSGKYVYTTSGVYEDTIQNNEGCDSLITINLTVSSSVLDSMKVSSCKRYTLPSGLYTAHQSGVYIDVLQRKNGCDSILHIDLSINRPDTAVIQQDSLLTANANNVRYQWLYCDVNTILHGDTNQSFIPDKSGYYAVIINDQDCIDTSKCFEVGYLNLKEIQSLEAINVYPNPFLNSINLEVLRSQNNRLKIELLTIQGELIISDRISFENKKTITLDVPSGLYILKLTNSKGEFMYRRLLKE